MDNTTPPEGIGSEMSQEERQRLTTIITIATRDYEYDNSPSFNGIRELRMAAVTKAATTFCDHANLMDPSAELLEGWKVFALTARAEATLTIYAANSAKDPRITNKPAHIIDTQNIRTELAIRAGLLPLRTRKSFAKTLDSTLAALQKKDDYIMSIIAGYRIPEIQKVADLIAYATFDGILIAIEYLIDAKSDEET